MPKPEMSLCADRKKQLVKNLVIKHCLTLYTMHLCFILGYFMVSFSGKSTGMFYENIPAGKGGGLQAKHLRITSAEAAGAIISISSRIERGNQAFYSMTCKIGPHF